MSQFLIMIRDEGVDFSQYAPAELEAMISKFVAWSKELKAKGQHVLAEKLKDDGGRTLRVKAGKVVVNGPYADIKEMVTGIFVVDAKDYDAAVAIARGCPALTYGGSVEIREIDGM